MFSKKDRWLTFYMHLVMIKISFIAHIKLVDKINNHKLIHSWMMIFDQDWWIANIVYCSKSSIFWYSYCWSKHLYPVFPFFLCHSWKRIHGLNFHWVTISLSISHSHSQFGFSVNEYRRFYSRMGSNTETIRY